MKMKIIKRGRELEHFICFKKCITFYFVFKNRSPCLTLFFFLLEPMLKFKSTKGEETVASQYLASHNSIT